MHLILDWDNQSQIYRSRGLRATVEKIVAAVGMNLANCSNLHARLYGGWFEGNLRTRVAQYLDSEIAKGPWTYNIEQPPGVKPKPIVLQATMAETCLATPKVQIHNTLKEQRVRKSLQCKPPANICPTGKANSDCFINNLHSFIANWQCPDPICNVTPDQALFFKGQKIVDTMMVADIVYLTLNMEKEILIASSDEDILPAILVAKVTGARIWHVFETRKTREFSLLAGGNYSGHPIV